MTLLALVNEASGGLVVIDEAGAGHGSQDAEKRREDSGLLDEVERLLEHGPRVGVEADDEVADHGDAAGMYPIDGFLIGQAEVYRLVHVIERRLAHRFEPD